MMSDIKRRQFLQFAGSAITTIGLSQFDLIKQGNQYGKILAQGTPRKLALLVGINNYPKAKRFTNLQGCVNDVELQRQLLIYRFGFNPKDIQVLTDQQATRDGILTAFNEHLITQAKAGDVVVFHFSGHGSRVADSAKINPDGLNSTFVPADDTSLAEKGIVNDIMGRTLFLLMSALGKKTENFTAVLDSCHSGGGTRGKVRMRTIDGGSDYSASPTELEYQQQWMKQLNISPADLPKARSLGVATGVVLAAAGRTESAADYNFPGFSAGAFTYLLTQYLWQQTSSVETLMTKVSRNIKPLSNQAPLFEVKPNSGNEKKSVYFQDKQVAPAEAVITEIKGNEATLWLGGIAQDSMDAFGEGATFVTLATGRGAAPTQVELKSRNGLFGTAVIKNGTAQPGALLQESARAIPNDLKLLIGLDPSLGGEAAGAKTALQALTRTEAVPAQAANMPDTQQVHYIFSKMTAAYRQQLQQSQTKEIPAEGSIGLFSPSLELIPNSFGQPGETVAQAIARLKPKLRSLLAARIVKLTLNADSSRLKLGVNMNYSSSPGQTGQIIGKAYTPRGCEEPARCLPIGSRGQPAVLTQQIPIGSSLQFDVKNDEETPLYLGILLVDPSQGIVILFPNDLQQRSATAQDDGTLINPGQTLKIPDPSKQDFQLIPEVLGVGEVLVIASKKPLKKALLRLVALAPKPGERKGFIQAAGDEAIAVIDDMVQDLSNPVGKSSSLLKSSHSPLLKENDRPLIAVRKVSVSQMAALSISFEVVKKA
jgi:Caspase domain/Domain of unknown function (DUF4384)